MRTSHRLRDLRVCVRSLAWFEMTVLASAAIAQSPTPKAPVDQLIPWLLDEDRQLRSIPFTEVIQDATGKRVLAVDPKNGRISG